MQHDEMTDRLERVKACLNGGRSKADHPAVPVTPAELAAEAAAAVGPEPGRCTSIRADGDAVSGNAELTSLALAAWTDAAALR